MAERGAARVSATFPVRDGRTSGEEEQVIEIQSRQCSERARGYRLSDPQQRHGSLLVSSSSAVPEEKVSVCGIP